MKTPILCFDDFTLVTTPAHIVEIRTLNDGKTSIILDQTAFCPDTAGQMCDTGIITDGQATFAVEQVTYNDGILHHIGRFTHGSLAPKTRVECRVDERKRSLNSRIHSAGHIIDMAADALNLNWEPIAYNHAHTNAHVDYEGSILEGNKDDIRSHLEAKCNALIEQKMATYVMIADKQELGAFTHHLAQNVPSEGKIYVVMYGDFAVPCNGTHVLNTEQIGKLTIRDIKIHGNVIRVDYSISG